MNEQLEKAQPFATSTYRRIAKIGYFGLLILMPLWLFVINPGSLSPLLSFGLFILPLLLPMRGIILGKPYTYAWANFVVLIYFLHSLTTLWVNPEETFLASLEFVLSALMFFGATYYAKFRGKELGLGIKKLSVELAEEKSKMSAGSKTSH
ncbi:DUF2069 domain-containing protein [Thalassotalea atypica]|uniref:DUF2069 domain-containing protein n=1 Tax=Thalassotalea atypica TaxID=2054316 RepID=UPI0025739BE6|nr:DUF2069 domain-containing protein [Thalassotalea atypica]